MEVKCTIYCCYISIERAPYNKDVQKFTAHGNLSIERVQFCLHACHIVGHKHKMCEVQIVQHWLTVRLKYQNPKVPDTNCYNM